MNQAVQLTAAKRVADRVLSEITATEVRQHLGLDEGQGAVDVQAVHYHLHTAEVTIPDPPTETVEYSR